MKLTSQQIFKEYDDALTFKESIGKRGISEQSKINERFFIGDQWHGANCGNERPLVRYNIIKRIADYKMSHILANPINVGFSADGIPNTTDMRTSITKTKKELASGKNFDYSSYPTTNEVNTVMSTLGDYHKVTGERVNFSSLCEQALKKAYISGSAIIYTYWNPDINTGTYADKNTNLAITGDISCELLDIENVFFSDASESNVEKQPYIILRSYANASSLLREGMKYQCSYDTKRFLSEKGEEKVLVLTRLYKEYNSDGSYTIKCIKAVEGGILRDSFDTLLSRYPLALFTWDNAKDCIYGNSEITYLIPNQIAINRMITANVWAMMTQGMPIMVVNGDTVTDKITNEPGQIIKVYGTNEDVAGSIKYVTPTNFNGAFDSSINTLIENTLTQSGANQVALGDSRADNATALITMRNAAVMPISLVKTRFYSFVEEIAKIWIDFWISYYGNRKIKVVDENGVWYMPFHAERYKNLIINARVYTSAGNTHTESETVDALNSLYDKGIITKKQFIKRLPEGLVSDIEGLLNEVKDTEETIDERT
ncbi:MAG: hypothetical protein IJP22_01130 [Clostridia bacterium]|nr:hypothetical protein [Clostridia bacterium]